jgi:pyruvate ferredoxin oxidoreductase alpha subunit
MFVNGLVPPEDFTEMRFQQRVGFDGALQVIPEIQKEFSAIFGRQHRMIEAFRCEDADAVLVTLGSMSGSAKHVANRLGADGKKVGVIKVLAFRPFPGELLRDSITSGQTVGVLDRTAGLGAQSGPLCLEVRSALGQDSTQVHGYIGGLGGRDVNEATLESVFDELLQISRGRIREPANPWIDVRPNAMTIRST